MRKFFSALFTLVLLLIASVFFASPAQAGETPNITICHQTGPEPGRAYIPERMPKIGYTSITVSKTALIKGKSEHSGDTGDIVPYFEYAEDDGVEKTFPGKNWTPANQSIYYNGCAKPNQTVTPIAPVFDQATCMAKNGVLIPAQQPEGVLPVQEPSLVNGVWSVVYKAAEGYSFPEGVSGTYTYAVTPPGPSDPNWDAEAGECRIANTGATGFSNFALMMGGGGVGLAAILLFVSGVMKRRETA